VTDFDLDAFKAELAERGGRRLSGDGGQRPHWADIEADERRERLHDLPSELSVETETRGDWQDAMAEAEDRTLTDELPPGYDPRCFG
jgi:hypothetical protein